MADHVLVRMYNVGFGDCFLIEFPRAGQPPFRVLVDCGAHTSGYPRDGWRPADVVDQIIADVTQENRGPVLDVVVATHRHQDHVSGFSAEAWDDVTVDQVWMPWTEDPDDPEAKAIRERQGRLALGLELAFQQPGFDSRWLNPDVRQSLRSLVANSLTNESAMRTLHRGFKGKQDRNFLSTANARTINVPGCDGLTAHVLGPSRDRDVIRDMDPPTGQSYLRFSATSAAGGARTRGDIESIVGRTRGPFTRSFTMSASDYEADGVGIVLDDDVKAAASAMMRDDDVAAAVSLDKAVNGTSLMLMFEFGEAFLLFPGDAQWGTWEAAMNDPGSRDLLAKTTFYKVGHHGSHNATPIEFVEEVLRQDRKLWGAAVSVRPISFWPEIPREPLVDALKARFDRVVSSHQPGRSARGFAVRRESVGVDFHVPC